MIEPSVGRRHAIALAVLAVAVVGLAGCTGTSGVSDGTDLFPSDASSQVEANVTTEAASTTESPAGETTPTDEPSTDSAASSSEAAEAGDSRDAGDAGEPTETDAESSPPAETTAAPATTAESTTTSERSSSSGGGDGAGGSAGAGDGGADTSEDGGSGGGAGSADDTSPSTAQTTSSGSTDACDAYDEQVGPHSRAELVSDDEVCVTSWDDSPYPDSFTVAGYVGNPSGETIDHVNVEVVLYGPDGSELARKSDGIDDLGESGRFVVTFEEVFAAEGAPAPDDALSYRIHTTVGESAASSTSTEQPASTPAVTTAPPTTAPSTTAAPPTTASAPASTTPAASTTDAPETADACEAYEFREGPPRAELESDDAICITEWDNQPFVDTYVVSGVVANPSGETIDRVDVEVTLFDGDGNVLDRKTDEIDDLGETDRFTLEFTELFEGEDALEPDRDVASYRINATVSQPATPGATTAESTPTGTESPVPTTTSGQPEATTSEPSTAIPEPTETESDGGVEGSVESDEYTSVTDHAFDTSGGDAVVTGTLTNPTDARIDDPGVRVVLYDDEGDEIAYGSGSATEEAPVSPLYEPGERGSFEVRFPDVDPADVASYTIRSTATDPAEDPANTRADVAVTFLRLSWLDAPLETYLEVTNQKEETVERLDVVVTAYDENETVIAEHTEPIEDLGIGETVTFEHVFDVTDDEVARVEVDVPGEDYGFVN